MNLGNNLLDPLETRRKNAAEKLNRRRLATSETSKKIAEDRNSFFDRLAILNAGALTFSVTLLGHFAPLHPSRTFILHTAWALLVIALGACLLRNLVHQYYRASDVVALRAEAEIAFIDVDTEVISTRAVVYSDSAEPFDKERELSLNRANREIWKKHYNEELLRSEQHWGIVQSAEWVAAVSMFFGFLLLVLFAVLNT
jgi:hypothetical protein